MSKTTNTLNEHEKELYRLLNYVKSKGSTAIAIRARSALEYALNEIERLQQACDIFEKNSADATAVWEENRRLNRLIEIGFHGSPPPIPMRQLLEGHAREVDRLTAALHANRCHPSYCYLTVPADATFRPVAGSAAWPGWERNPEAETVPGDEMWRRRKQP